MTVDSASFLIWVIFPEQGKEESITTVVFHFIDSLSSFEQVNLCTGL